MKGGDKMPDENTTGGDKRRPLTTQTPQSPNTHGYVPPKIPAKPPQSGPKAKGTGGGKNK